MELGGDGWSWVKVDAQFNNTHLIITSVSLRHCVSAKIFVEYLSFCFFGCVLKTEAATRGVLFLKMFQIVQENISIGVFI